jgi:hypothetical protein
MKFKPYESKPVTRMAFQIRDIHVVKKSKSEESSYFINQLGDIVSNSIKFKAYEEPKVGDWIVRLTDTDTYHCTDEVFRERNVVPEDVTPDLPQASKLWPRTKSG